MESNSIQYQIERNCDLIHVRCLLDSKGYGIAFTPGIKVIQSFFSCFSLYIMNFFFINSFIK